MTAHKYYKRGLVIAEPILAPFCDWEVREQGESGAHCYTDEMFRKTYAPLPVIPQAVGEIIRDDREAGRDLAFVLYKAVLMASRRSRTEGKNVYSWIAENQDTFALAWLLGEWEVEE